MGLLDDYNQSVYKASLWDAVKKIIGSLLMVGWLGLVFWAWSAGHLHGVRWTLPILATAVFGTLIYEIFFDWI